MQLPTVKGSAMTGVKQYDRTELLDRAIELFRLRGYGGTTTAMLVDELGVNRKSMYAEFGSKQGLFEAALDRYSAKHLTAVLAPIEARDAGPAAINEAFAGYASASTGWARGRGCLMCNTAVERAALDPASGRHVERYFERLTRAFRAALRHGEQAGEIEVGDDIDRLAGFLTTSLVGVAASIRADAPPEQIPAAAAVVARVLDGYRPRTRVSGPTTG